jgi:hypothetical protein
MSLGINTLNLGTFDFPRYYALDFKSDIVFIYIISYIKSCYKEPVPITLSRVNIKV